MDTRKPRMSHQCITGFLDMNKISDEGRLKEKEWGDREELGNRDSHSLDEIQQQRLLHLRILVSPTTSSSWTYNVFLHLLYGKTLSQSQFRSSFPDFDSVSVFDPGHALDSNPDLTLGFDPGSVFYFGPGPYF
ncbi:hypothetical protein EVAR_18200_1 [Eumeta japonica]|uniref:Uncharacterized protein n=1 Tax=Eumeta variegata TaxID=151549 RepID=A0A4C1UV85_EUMVA|nr:hypothetical protein EVAR_18200_1 [Eumeta japonica]